MEVLDCILVAIAFYNKLLATLKALYCYTALLKDSKMLKKVCIDISASPIVKNNKIAGK